MAPEVYIQHQLPGRIRLKIPAMRGNRAFFDAVSNQLSLDPEITALESNPVTGSLLIRHRKNTEAFIAFAEQNGLGHIGFQSGEREAGPGPGGQIADPTKRPGSKHWMNLATLGFVGLTVPALRQGKYFGSATENFWNAYQAHTKNLNLWTWILAGAGVYQLAQGNVITPVLSLLFFAASARQVAQGEATDPAG